MLIFSFGLSLLFLVGIVQLLYPKVMYAKVTFYSLIYYVLAFSAFRILFALGYLPFLPSEYRDEFIFILFTVFLAFGIISTQGILSRLTTLSSILILFLISGVLFPILYYLIQVGLFSELKVVDQNKSSFLFIATGSMVWFFEIFLKDDSHAGNLPSEFTGNFLYLLGLPIVLLIPFGLFPTEELFRLAIKFYLGFCLVQLGIFFVNKTSELSNHDLALGYFSVIALLSNCIMVSIYLLLPICFALGIFLPLWMRFLKDRKWTRNGSLLLNSFLVCAALSLFSVILLLPDTDWPHPPLVLLGVQFLFLLSVFLFSNFIASIVYFLPKSSID